MILILFGVSGSGKTTSGETFARRRGWKFVDADDLHTAANKDKMRAGIPLDDDDRLPWLLKLREVVRNAPPSTPGAAPNDSVVFVFSGLKQRYRDLVRDGREDCLMIHLTGSFETVAARLELRQHEYMNPKLLKSQYEALEAPSESERIVAVSIEDPPERVLQTLDTVVREFEATL